MCVGPHSPEPEKDIANLYVERDPLLHMTVDTWSPLLPHREWEQGEGPGARQCRFCGICWALWFLHKSLKLETSLKHAASHNRRVLGRCSHQVGKSTNGMFNHTLPGTRETEAHTHIQALSSGRSWQIIQVTLGQETAFSPWAPAVSND